MVLAQALEHLCTRRIAGLGLFRSRQAEPLEQDFAQLTGAVQVELRAGIQIDLIHKVADARFQTFAERAQRIGRDSAACVLHLREHPLERQLNFVIQPAHAELLDLIVHLAEDLAHRGEILRRRAAGLLASAERRKRRRIVQIERGKHFVHAGEREPRQVVARLRRVDEVGRESGVERDAARIEAAEQQIFDDVLRVVQCEVHAAVKQTREHIVPCVPHIVRIQKIRRVPGKQAERTECFPCKDKNAVRLGQRVDETERLERRGDGAALQCRQARRGGLLTLRQTELSDELVELQPCQQAVQRLAVDLLFGQMRNVQLERYIPVDGSEPVAVARSLLVRL